MKYFIVIIAFFIFTQVDAKKKYYKWTDADGDIHYSESKPQNTQTSEIKVDNSKSTNTIRNVDASEEEPVQNNEKSDNEKAIDEYNKKEQARALKQQQKQSCKIAKKNLTTLQQTVRVRKIDPVTGESVRMGDSERKDRLNQAKKLIKEVCN